MPLRIGTFLTSEVVLGQANVGKALAFGMIVVVAVTMTVYALLQRRTVAMAALTGARPRRAFGAGALRWAVLLSIGAYMLLPLVAMLEFSTRGIGGARSLEPWLAIGANPDLLAAIRVSLELAVLTVVGDAGPAGADDGLGAAAPAAAAAPGRVPLPAAARPSRRSCWWSGSPRSIAGCRDLLGESPNTLTFVYIVLVLPFAYRALAAGLGGDRPRDPRRGRPQPRLLAGSA